MEDIINYIRDQAYRTGLLTQSVGDKATHWLLTLNSGGTTAILATLLITKDVNDVYWLKIILISFLIGTITSISGLFLRYSILNSMTSTWSKTLTEINEDPTNLLQPKKYFDELESHEDKVKYIYYLEWISFVTVCFGIIYGIYQILIS